LAAYLDQGGRFMYMGGNGFYWKIVPNAEGPWAFELRRAEGGIRLWETLPGESYHGFDGSYGGLWRRLGRPPQALVGVGFSTQGEYKSYPYNFLDGILDPRVAFMRADMEDSAVPGQVFGERGFMGGGAAGHELDRADTRLGTPEHAIIVGRAVLHDSTYQPVNEERRDHTWPAAREDIIRSDLTFFETPSGGGGILRGIDVLHRCAAGRRLRQHPGKTDHQRCLPLRQSDPVRSNLDRPGAGEDERMRA
jgi:N,N-dimethylformamidase